MFNLSPAPLPLPIPSISNFLPISPLRSTITVLDHYNLKGKKDHFATFSYTNKIKLPYLALFLLYLLRNFPARFKNR